MTSGLRIGELSKLTGCHIETIRYYERMGLLRAPERTDGNYRLYHHEHVERLRFIRRCRALDMALGEIRVLLEFRDTPRKSCGDVNVLLDNHITQLALRIAELQETEKQLKEIRRTCVEGRTAKQCGILNELTQAARAVH